MAAGKLNRRVHAQKRGDLSDGWGGVTPGAGEFETQFTVAAEFRPMRGGEAVIAARLTGKQPYVVRVRNAATTRAIRHDWRLVDARTNEVLELRSPVHDPDGKRAWLEFVVEAETPNG
ncbi:MAG TPA: head-tail adaptor protein [Pelagibacterium sp.]|uniref:head-tail adaptor protein n=1 Tax=Pelagibacterium sp. TaxID=1967288 RepID=UPI002CB818F7|nr:head-tail adaptor protein [Pelagibacterium sp.]HWJ89091.1 head-tail adaptor protein [Pelagibacterium sp.]